MKQQELFVEPTPQVFTPDQKLLALSWKQPYATAMIGGKIETRTWSTKYRGWVLICTSKQAYSEGAARSISREEFIPLMGMLNSLKKQFFNTLDLNGYAIAIGYLHECLPMNEKNAWSAYVHYNPDLFCHFYKNVQPIEPFEWKGSQGWKEVNTEIKEQIKIISFKQ